MVFDPRLEVNRADENTLLSPQAQISSRYDLNISIAAASAASVLGVGYPIGFNTSTAKHAPWMAPDPTVLAIFLGSTPATGGTFEVSINGVALDFAFNVTAAVIDETLKGQGHETTTVLAASTYTITFDNEADVAILPTVAGDITNLTGDTASTSVTTAGTSTFGTNKVRGFINPNPTVTGIKTGSITLAGSGTTATATTVNPHGLVTGMEVTVTGAVVDTDYNVVAQAIVVVTDKTFTYTAGGTVSLADSASYTTTNDIMATMMVKGIISNSLPAGLVATADVTALATAMKSGLIADGLIVQGLTGRY